MDDTATTVTRELVITLADTTGEFRRTIRVSDPRPNLTLANVQSALAPAFTNGGFFLDDTTSSTATMTTLVAARTEQTTKVTVELA